MITITLNVETLEEARILIDTANILSPRLAGETFTVRDGIFSLGLALSILIDQYTDDLPEEEFSALLDALNILDELSPTPVITLPEQNGRTKEP